MELYSYWRSTAAYRVRIALNFKTLAFNVIPVNLLDAEARLSYQVVNPQGLVPALVDQGGADDTSITQSSAIIEYLEEQYPNPPLLPEAPDSRAIVRTMCQLIACDIHPLNNLRVLNYLRQELDQSDDAVDAWYRHWIAEGFEPLEDLVRRHRGACCVGDSISMADVFLVPQLYNARRFDCDLSGYPNLVEIGNRLGEDERFSSAAPENQPDAPG